MLYNVNDLYVGRSLDLYGEYSEAEIDVLKQIIRPGDLIVDAGANIGTHTIFFAKTVGPTGVVLAFEPQRVFFQTLCANLALNGLTNTHCYQAALGDVEDTIIVPPLDYSKEINLAALSLEGHQQGERVRLTTLDSINAPRCRLIKIDVEGMELAVLRGAARWIREFRPALYVENERAAKSAGLIAHILELGYRLYWHAPPMFQRNNYFGNVINVFGNTISVNMLCLDAALPQDIRGLVEVKGPEDNWQRLFPGP
jgi:FkbM family methyltransferase